MSTAPCVCIARMRASATPETTITSFSSTQMMLLSVEAPRTMWRAAFSMCAVSSTTAGGLPGPAQMARLPLAIAAFTTALFGIVKKNSIPQVDYTNTLREQGLHRHTAIIQANHVRLRPILMTTIAIVAGMLPIAFGRGAGSGSRASMAVTIIGGQLLCLLLTLLVTPIVYSYFDGLRAMRPSDVLGLLRFRRPVKSVPAADVGALQIESRDSPADGV